jgi:hypothetical protein
MKELNYILFSVCTDTNNEGYLRFINSCEENRINYKILGIGKEWFGGNMELGPGGGQKVNLLKLELDTMSIDELKQTVIIFTDSYDVIVSSNMSIIKKKIDIFLNKYKKPLENTVIFSSEKTCWPNQNKEILFKKTKYGYNYLNSGGFIGKANVLKELLINKINNYDDDQEYYMNIYLNQTNINILLDSECLIFQTLNNSLTDLIRYNNKLINKVTHTEPCILHANGPKNIKEQLFMYYDLYNNKILYKGDGIYTVTSNILNNKKYFISLSINI